MLLEGFPELRGQHGFFLSRLEPIAEDDEGNPHDASPLVNRQGSAKRGQIDAGVNGMPETSIWSGAYELMVFFKSDPGAPILS